MIALVEPGPELPPERIARYSRQLMLPGFGEAAQRRLAAARVLVIGAGGLGSALVPALAGSGVGTIGVIDDDVVEFSNLHRQLSHGMDDIGRSKVGSLADTVRDIDPGILVRPYRERASAETLPAILSEYDLLVDGSDNFPTRYLADDAARLAGKPLVWGSILRFQGQVGVSVPEVGFRDLFPVPPDPDEVLSCELGGVLASLCTAIGSFMATEVVKLLTGIGEPLIGRVLFYDALTARTREIAYERAADADPVTELVDYELFCGLGSTGAGARDETPSVSAAEVLRLQREGGVRLLDVREPHEIALRGIPGAAALPLGALAAGEDPQVAGGPLVVFCEKDPRSQRAVRVLRGRGIDARYLAGGIGAYVAVGGRTEGAGA
ncbi:Sulfur carrier protein CysO adenylyltransferase / Sulfur carrier protein CysO sulfurtransferase [Microbacterium sp. 8M]|uniref:ThiF family adenylyltransferase n=1 Tax=Microbacterium sp. 8M TaxID=2653153 RepID=UPI0012F17F0B|nr:ThiF family adenylyltransferase [Microbacterium sp. 8M]VXB44070.1 Sulfur carrier protein CysO adenylyltransferase / Sulfur carrier protein CysO sulfurtransferase [Microbacterium sp. 8M]